MSKSPFVPLCLLMLVSGLASVAPGNNEPPAVATGESALDHAERLFAEGSYGLALERYEALDPRARKLLDQWLAAGSSSESWTCAGCGETIEPPLASCWRCGREHP